MLMRCAGRMLAAPVVMGTGLAMAGAVAVAATAGAGVLGAAYLVKRMREERQGWREGAGGAAGDDLPPIEPADQPVV